MFVTDTHPLAWHLAEVSAPDRRRARRGLSPRARRIFTAADEGREVVLIPSIVLVELIYLSERGIIATSLVDQLLAALAPGPENYHVAPLDLHVVSHLRDFPASAVPEMPDRIIAATARATRSRLISRDESIGRAAHVEVVW